VRRAAVQAVGKISAKNTDYRAECVVAGALPSLYALLASSDLDCVEHTCAELPHLFDGFHEVIKKAGFHTRVMTLLKCVTKIGQGHRLIMLFLQPQASGTLYRGYVLLSEHHSLWWPTL
jgi:hypothetical protein